MPYYSRDSCIAQEVHKYVGLGWIFLHGGKHGKLRSPCGTVLVIVPCTPGTHRAHRNFRSTLRRAQRQVLAMK